MLTIATYISELLVESLCEIGKKKLAEGESVILLCQDSRCLGSRAKRKSAGHKISSWPAQGRWDFHLVSCMICGFQRKAVPELRFHPGFPHRSEESVHSIFALPSLWLSSPFANTVLFVTVPSALCSSAGKVRQQMHHWMWNFTGCNLQILGCSHPLRRDDTSTHSGNHCSSFWKWGLLLIYL